MGDSSDGDGYYTITNVTQIPPRVTRDKKPGDNIQHRPRGRQPAFRKENRRSRRKDRQNHPKTKRTHTRSVNINIRILQDPETYPPVPSCERRINLAEQSSTVCLRMHDLVNNTSKRMSNEQPVDDKTISHRHHTYMGDEQMEQHVDWQSEHSQGTTEETFPFQKTPSGNLKIAKEQVSLQSRNVAIIIADPRRMLLRNFREERISPTTKFRNQDGLEVVQTNTMFRQQDGFGAADTKTTFRNQDGFGAADTYKIIRSQYKGEADTNTTLRNQHGFGAADTKTMFRNQDKFGAVDTNTRFRNQDEFGAVGTTTNTMFQNQDGFEALSNSNDSYRHEFDNVEVDEEAVEAARLIQRTVRGWLARKKYGKLKRAALAVQAAYRASQKKIPIKLRGLRVKDGESILIIGGYDKDRDIGLENPSTCIFQLNTIRNLWNLHGDLPGPRARHGTVQIGKFLYIFGGEDRTKVTKTGKNVKCSTTWSLDLVAEEWTELSRMTTARSYFGYAVVHNKIYVFGGLDENATAQDTCEVYDPSEDRWRPFRSMDGPRLSPAVAKSGDKIWVVGGFTKIEGNPMLKSTMIYDTTKNQYYVGPDLPFPRCNGSLVAYYDQLFLLGGATYIKNEIESLSDVSRLSSGEWVTVGHLKTGARHGHCALQVGKYVLLVGGVNSETMEGIDQVESFSLEKLRGSTKVTNLPLKLCGASGAVIR